MFCFFYFQTVPTSSPFLACNLFKNLQKIQKRVLRADKDHTNSLTYKNNKRQQMCILQENDGCVLSEAKLTI